MDDADGLDGDWSGVEEIVGGTGLETLEQCETSLVMLWEELWTCCGLTATELLIHEDWGMLEEDGDWSGVEEIVGGTRLETLELWETSLFMLWEELWTCSALTVTELLVNEDWGMSEEDGDDLDGDWSSLEEIIIGTGLETLELWETSLVMLWEELWTCCGLTVTELLVNEDWGMFEEDGDDLDVDWSGVEEIVGGTGLENLEQWETSLVMLWEELWTCCGLTVTELLINEDSGLFEEDGDGLDGDWSGVQDNVCCLEENIGSNGPDSFEFWETWSVLWNELWTCCGLTVTESTTTSIG